MVPPILSGTDFLFQQVRLLTNIDSSDLARGLKIDDTFSVNAIFDLILPEGIVEEYGISLTDRTATSPGNDLRLVVRHTAENPVRVIFARVNPAADTFTILGSSTLIASASQISLTLSRPTTSNNGVVASFFTYVDPSVPSPTTTFATAAEIFRGENFTRARFIAESRLPE